jgi:hypothetical protein
LKAPGVTTLLGSRGLEPEIAVRLLGLPGREPDLTLDPTPFEGGSRTTVFVPRIRYDGGYESVTGVSSSIRWRSLEPLCGCGLGGRGSGRYRERWMSERSPLSSYREG